MVGLKEKFKQVLQIAQLVETLATLDVEIGLPVRVIAEVEACLLLAFKGKLVAKDLALAKVGDASCDWDPAKVDGFSHESELLGSSRSGESLGWLDPDPPDPSDPPVSTLPGKFTTPPPTP